MLRNIYLWFGIFVAVSLLEPAFLFLFAIYLKPPAIILSHLTHIGGLITSIVALLALRLSGITLSQIGINFPSLKKAVKWSGVAWFLIGALLGVGMLLVPDGAVKITSVGTIIKFYLFVGLPEELLFRGYFFTWLFEFFKLKVTAKRAKVIALVCSSLIFALSHIPQRLLVAKMALDFRLVISLVKVMIDGLIAGWIFMRTKNLWFTAIWHGGVDNPIFSLSGHKDLTGWIVTLVYLGVTEALRRRSGKGVEE